MLFINAVSKDHSELRVIYSPEHPEIEFQYPMKQIIESVKNGRIYKTTYVSDGKYVEGEIVEVVNGNLQTKRNDTELDNLSNLPKF